MKFRFALWNTNYRANGDGQRLIHLINSVHPHVVALVEVNPKFHAELARQKTFTWSASSLSLRPPGPGDGEDRKRDCSIFGRPPFSLSALYLVPEINFPEQTIVAELESPDGGLRVCGSHTPPGATHKEKKPKYLRRMAEWLETQNSRTIFAIDANTPKRDCADIRDNEWWWPEDEPLLLGSPEGPAPRRVHKLEDTYRVYLSQVRGPRQAKTDEPLAVSYIRGHGDKAIKCRYDFICATPDISVEKVEYVDKASWHGLSDHAMVVADLEVTT